jgi:protoporphyrinogen IX oxidase
MRGIASVGISTGGVEAYSRGLTTASSAVIFAAHRDFDMLWIKAFHIVFVVTWFAGLFYLPRLLVYHAEASEPVVRERLKIMERRLLVMTRIGSTLTVVFGVATLLWLGHGNEGYFHQGWLIAKLVLVAGLFGYQAMLSRLVRNFAADANTRSSRWLRLFNEVPIVFLIAIVVLVVVKPF